VSIRKPNDVRNRGGKIIMPGQAPGADDIAAQQVAAENQLKNHPFFRMISQLEQQGQLLAMQNRVLASRFNGLMDYLNHVGLLLTQPLDKDTGLVDDTVPPQTAEGAVSCFFEDLVVEGVLGEMPKYGLERFIEEHVAHGHFMSEVNEKLMNGTYKMEDAIEHAREFNANPRRFRKVNGDQFQLPQWLTANPDGLEEEELDALAKEFGLAKHEEPAKPAPAEEAQEDEDKPKLELV
jgi:hypothetical protein